MRSLDSLPTPCLLIDRAKLESNARRMRRRADELGVALRPHLKTAKSMEVARAAAGDASPKLGAVSTLEEAAYFIERGMDDLIYAVGITEDKLDRVAAIDPGGASVSVIADDLQTARAVAARDETPACWLEIDSGQHRGGVDPESDEVLAIARALGGSFAGVLTHAGHSYRCRSIDEVRGVAEQERAAAVRAAERIRDAGMPVARVSVGSTPTALHAAHLEGVTELRAGVYVFFDRFQAAIHSCATSDIALSVLSSVVSRRDGAVWIDAGTLAMSSEQSLAPFGDLTYGQVVAMDGTELEGRPRIDALNQVHGRVVASEGPPLASSSFPVGARLRVLPNHACITAAMFDRYYVVEDDVVVAEWPRLRG